MVCFFLFRINCYLCNYCIINVFKLFFIYINYYNMHYTGKPGSLPEVLPHEYKYSVFSPFISSLYSAVLLPGLRLLKMQSFQQDLPGFKMFHPINKFL